LLIYSPDLLSRKYAYQVLLTEEFSRHKVEVEFIKTPKPAKPEEELLLQSQGTIAEYERAQIVECNRRGKRDRTVPRQDQSMCSPVLLTATAISKRKESSSGYYQVIEKQALQLPVWD